MTRFSSALQFVSFYYDEGFGYIRKDHTRDNVQYYSIGGCKEISGEIEREIDGFIAYRPENCLCGGDSAWQVVKKQVEEKDYKFGLNSNIQIVDHHVAGRFLLLEDTWYNTNFLTRELGRIVLKQRYEDIIDPSFWIKSYKEMKEGLDNFKKFWNKPVEYIDSLSEDDLKLVEQKRLEDKSKAFGLIKCILEIPQIFFK